MMHCVHRLYLIEDCNHLTGLVRSSSCNQVTGLVRSSSCNHLTGLVRSSSCNQVTGLVRSSTCNQVTSLVRSSSCNQVTGLVKSSSCNQVTGLVRSRFCNHLQIYISICGSSSITEPKRSVNETPRRLPPFYPPPSLPLDLPNPGIIGAPPVVIIITSNKPHYS